MAEQTKLELLGGPLVLRHSSKRVSGTWGAPIHKCRAGVPEDRPWMWTITGAALTSGLPSRGFCATRKEAMAALAETWRAWSALTRR